jgi:hypothetical protein
VKLPSFTYGLDRGRASELPPSCPVTAGRCRRPPWVSSDLAMTTETIATTGPSRATLVVLRTARFDFCFGCTNYERLCARPASRDLGNPTRGSRSRQLGRPATMDPGVPGRQDHDPQVGVRACAQHELTSNFPEGSECAAQFTERRWEPASRASMVRHWAVGVKPAGPLRGTSGTLIGHLSYDVSSKRQVRVAAYGVLSGNVTSRFYGARIKKFGCTPALGPGLVKFLAWTLRSD